jgi:hypothetical protein
MFIIDRRGGLPIAILAFAFGILATLASGLFSLGLLIIGFILMWFGRKGRRDIQTGERLPAPSIYFIPLFWIGVVVLSLVVPSIGVDLYSHTRPTDPREEHVRVDERILSEKSAGGDRELSSAIAEALLTSAPAREPLSEMHVYTWRREDGLLVLVKLPSLSEIPAPDRRALLDTIEQTARAKIEAGIKLYIGIKGKFMYGAIRTPGGTETGSAVLREPLFEFYGPAPPSKGPATAKAAS